MGTEIGMKNIVLVLDNGINPKRVVGRFDNPHSLAEEEQVVANRMISAALALMGAEPYTNSPVVGTRYAIPNGGVTVLEIASEINFSLFSK